MAAAAAAAMGFSTTLVVPKLEPVWLLLLGEPSPSSMSSS
jgi:hypothetical protein